MPTVQAHPRVEHPKHQKTSPLERKAMENKINCSLSTRKKLESHN
jgi:hypothetical protein